MGRHMSRMLRNQPAESANPCTQGNPYLQHQPRLQDTASYLLLTAKPLITCCVHRIHDACQATNSVCCFTMTCTPARSSQNHRFNFHEIHIQCVSRLLNIMMHHAWCIAKAHDLMTDLLSCSISQFFRIF
jgi:hypothetical protein